MNFGKVLFVAWCAWIGTLVLDSVVGLLLDQPELRVAVGGMSSLLTGFVAFLRRNLASARGEGLGKAAYQHVEARRARAARSTIMYNTSRAVDRYTHPEWDTIYCCLSNLPGEIRAECHPRLRGCRERGVRWGGFAYTKEADEV